MFKIVSECEIPNFKIPVKEPEKAKFPGGIRVSGDEIGKLGKRENFVDPFNPKPKKKPPVKKAEKGGARFGGAPPMVRLYVAFARFFCNYGRFSCFSQSLDIEKISQ